jgi:hypothetical protein
MVDVLGDTRKSRLLSVLFTYGLTVLTTIGGVFLRLLVHLPGERAIDQAHCYVWQPEVAGALVTLVAVAPLGIGLFSSRIRLALLVAIPLCALFLATFLWSHTVIQPCTNEF